MTQTTTEPTRSDVESHQAEAMADLVKRGSDALAGGDLKTALELFEQVIGAYPDQPEGHNNLGALYSSLGEFERAESCFDRVLALLPNNENVLYNRGVVRSRQEKFDLARDDFEAALRTCPRDPDLQNNLGVIAFAQGFNKIARKHFRKAMRLDPTNRNAVLNLCDVEVADGRRAAALTLCEEYLARREDPAIRRKLLELRGAECRLALEKARLEAETLLRTSPEENDVLRELEQLKRAQIALDASAAGTCAATG